MISKKESVSNFDDLIHSVEVKKDIINNPPHYSWHPVCECIDIVQEFPYNIGTAIAYMWRSGKKDKSKQLEDYSKAMRHIQFEIDRLKGKK